jgi:hypothetical protein
MRRLGLVLLATVLLAACSDGGQGTGGKKGSLSKGADDFMKSYGATESGVTDDTGKAGEKK